MSAGRVLIVGGGIAGLGAAWALSRAGVRDIELHDSEARLCAHASSRNAAILRTPMPDAVLEDFALEGAKLLARPPADLAGEALTTTNGVVLLGDPRRRSWLARAVARPSTRALAAAELAELHPLLAPREDPAWLIRDEGVIRLGALLRALEAALRRSGVRVHLRSRIVHLEPGAGAVDEHGRLHRAEHVVLATGAWAQALAARAGSPLCFRPARRHLAIAATSARLDPRWPVVWAEEEPFYARVCERGLLLSACDEELVDPEAAPADPRVVATILERARARLAPHCQLRLTHAWSCIRTHGPDERFVVGPDPALRGLWHLSGLGGHGITCGLPAALLLAEHMTRGGSAHPLAACFDPRRAATSSG
jgi:glycine/D-amino acid oxidase-like deaminating enzyme